MADDLAQALRDAAKIIAEQAKVNASGWSARIPPSIRVRGGGNLEVTIVATAPPAYPNEIPDVWHPVFGGPGTRRPKAPRVLNKHRPFLGPAADEKADAALREFGHVVDSWAIKAGFK